MASEDVIELGSSDEDTAEPAPKKVHMVHQFIRVCATLSFYFIIISSIIFFLEKDAA